MLPVAGNGYYELTATGQTSQRSAALGYNRTIVGTDPAPVPNQPAPNQPRPDKPTALPRTGVEGQGTAAAALGVLALAGLAVGLRRVRG